jgi:hypothetical protein
VVPMKSLKNNFLVMGLSLKEMSYIVLMVVLMISDSLLLLVKVTTFIGGIMKMRHVF